MLNGLFNDVKDGYHDLGNFTFSREIDMPSAFDTSFVVRLRLSSGFICVSSPLRLSYGLTVNFP